MGLYDNMNGAIKALKQYGPVASLDDFFLKAIQMNEGYKTASGKTVDTESAGEAVMFDALTNVMDGGLFTYEILAKIQEWAGMDITSEATEAELERIDQTGTAMSNAFQIICASAISQDNLSIRSSITLEDLLGGDMSATATKSPTSPNKSTPTMSLIQILPAMLNFGSRNTGAVEVFMNMIPAIEWSRALPYVDCQVITPGKQVSDSGKLRGISQLRFLNGMATVSGPDLSIASANSMDVQVMNADAAAEAEDGEPAKVFSSAGMEIFTSPQTLIPAQESYRSYDEVAGLSDPPAGPDGVTPWPGSADSTRIAPVIDRMRPFMTFTGVNIKVVPTRGMMSNKSAEVKLTLHDRSRLGEIADLVKPSSFGLTELLLEYGWSHPDGQYGNKANPYGMFINSMRVKEKYGVYNSKYTFTADGQVDITLSCVTRGSSAVNITNVGLSPEATTKYEALEKLIEAIQELRRTITGSTPEMPEIAGMSTIANLSPTNAGDMFSGDTLEEISAFIESAGDGGGDIGKLRDALTEAKDTTSEIQTTIAGTIDKKVTVAKGTGDPFLKPRGYPAGDSTPRIANHPERPGDGASWCSFGRLAALFIGAPIMETKRYDEVQLLFYTFNDKASWMYDQNIASFPVDLTGNTGFPKLFSAWQEDKVQVSVASFLSFMNRYYLTNMACKAYGFSNIFTRDEDGKAQVKENVNVNQLSSKKDEVLTSAYGENSDISFKLPRIRMIPECVPHKKAGPDDAEGAPGVSSTILRLHFFDDSAAKYSGLHDVLASVRSSEMGAVRAAANEVSNDADATDSNWEALTSEFQSKLSELSLIEKCPGDGDFYRVVGGAPALKYFIKNNMPSITYGSQHCAMQNMSMGSMHNSADTTIHMMRAQRESTSDSGTPGEQDRGLPIRMMPMQASGETMGCPLLNHGQQFFIDMGTGTTADNVYAVSGLDHSISPGDFKTKFKLIPIDAFGKYESMLNQVDKALAVISTAEAEGTET